MKLPAILGIIVTGVVIMIAQNPAANVRLWLLEDSREALALGDYCFNADKQGAYDLDCATRAYTYALSLDSTALYAWHQLARIDFLGGNFDAALIKINRQIDLHSDAIPGSYYVRGLIKGFDGDLSGAQIDFVKYLTLEPQSWGGHNDLAWIYFQKGEYEKAASQARTGLTFAPQNPWLLTSLGASLMNLGDKQGAKDALLRALAEANKLLPADWSRSNPGNDPRIGEAGLVAMRETIARNLALVD